MDRELVVERHGPVAWLTVNRPEVRNALNLQVTQRLTQEIRNLSRDRAVRVIVLTGAGDRVFISGADVGEFREQLARRRAALTLRRGRRAASIGAARGATAGDRDDPGSCGRERYDRGRLLRFSHCCAHGKIRDSGRQVRLHRARSGYVAPGAARRSCKGQVAADDWPAYRRARGAGDRARSTRWSSPRSSGRRSMLWPRRWRRMPR